MVAQASPDPSLMGHTSYKKVNPERATPAHPSPLAKDGLGYLFLGILLAKMCHRPKPDDA